MKVMRELVCINDKNLPQGANVVTGKVYKIVSEFINAYEQKGYVIEGVTNKGTTKWGVTWYGYQADRFVDLNDISIKELEEENVEELNLSKSI